MNTFDYWFDYIVRNGKYTKAGTQSVWNAWQKNENGFVLEAYWIISPVRKIIATYKKNVFGDISEYRAFLDDNDFKPIFARPIH